MTELMMYEFGIVEGYGNALIRSINESELMWKIDENLSPELT